MVDPDEGAAQARFAQYLCTGFGNTYNYILERSSEYTVGVL